MSQKLFLKSRYTYIHTKLHIYSKKFLQNLKKSIYKIFDSKKLLLSIIPKLGHQFIRLECAPFRDNARY